MIYRYSDIVINWYWYWYIGIDILIYICLILKTKLISYIVTTMCIHHANWWSQPQNMTLIHHPRMSHQPNDTKYKICCHYAEMHINILNHPIKIKHLASWCSFIIRGCVILFRGRGTPCGPKGRGCVPVCNMHQGKGEPRGGGTVMSHPFQEGVGGRDESLKEGWGDRDESSKRGVSQGGLHQSQPRGGSGGCRLW